MYSNQFPTHQIWLQEATILLTLLVFTSCSNSVLVLVLLESSSALKKEKLYLIANKIEHLILMVF